MRIFTMITLLLAASATAALAQAPASAPKGPPALHACSLVSEADVQRITGTTNQMKVPPSRSERPNGATQCNYIGLDIAVTPGVNAQNFQANRTAAAQQRNATTEPLAGVGDEAFYQVVKRSGSSSVGIVFRVGTHQVALGNNVPADSVEKFKPKLVELAKIAAAKLR